jgi:hypothetical protein
MKRITLFLATAVMAGSAIANVLTPEEALNRAKTTTASQHIKSLNASTPKLVNTYTAANQPAVYLFSQGDDKGYMVLSADDATEAVLGICDSGSIDVNNMPPAMTAWLEGYANQIAYVRENAPSSYQRPERVTKERKSILPICKTMWQQGSPYSDQCPNNYATGCVATCLAQILKTYNYPAKGEGTYSYSWNSSKLSFDFDSNPFDWDNMLDSYSDGTATDAQKEAVAKLMYACGVVVDMNYKSSGSGAYPINLLKTGPQYLKLDKGIRYYNRDYYGVDEWNDMVYEALSNGGPLMYNGCIVNSTQYAHEFVCDGYLDDDLFHINWGWGEDYNGYYRLTALDPYCAGFNTTSYGYLYYQDVVCYIKPAEANSKVYQQMYCGNNFAISTTTEALSNDIELTGGLYNYSAGAMSGVAGIKISDLNGNVICYSGDTKFTNLASQANLGTYKVTLPDELDNGTYVVTPAFKADSGEWQDVRTKISGTQSYTMNVSYNTCTFTPTATPALEISDFKLCSPIYANEMFCVTAKIKNPTSTEYSGKIALALISSNSAGTRKQTFTTSYYVPLYVPAGEEIDLKYTDLFTKGSGGTDYEIALVDGSGTYISDLIAVTMSSGSPTSEVYTTAPVFENVNNVQKEQIKASIDFSCKSGYFNKCLFILIYDVDDKGTAIGASNIATLSSDNVIANAGETVTVQFHGEMPNAVAGKSYRGFVSTNSNWVKTADDKYASTLFTIGESSGVSDVMNSEAEVVSTEYYTLQGSKVKASAIVPGLYIKAETLSNGARRASKCVIK